jgi:drug/metabolite transporter (DMT)-like permease
MKMQSQVAPTLSQREATVMPGKGKIVLAFLILYVVWGSTYMAIKYAIDTLPPFMMGSIRFLVAGFGLYAILRFSGQAKPALRHWLSAAVVGVLLLAVGNGGVVLASRYVPTGVVSLMVAMTPVYIAILEHMGKGLPGGKTIAGLILGTLGIGLLISPAGLSSQAVSGIAFNWFGILAVMVGSFAWSLGSIYSRRAHLPQSTMLAISMQMICGGIALSLCSFGLGEHVNFNLAQVSVRSLWAVAYLIVFGSLVGYTAYLWLLKHVSPSKVSTYAYVNPVIAVFLGWLMAGEVVSPKILLAGAVITCAVWLITQGNRK